MSYIIFIIIYLLQSYLIWRIALKMAVKPAWMAWLPFANDLLISRLANKHFGWWLLFYIPIVNIYVAYIFWTEIMRRFKKPFWLGIFMLLPAVNWVLLILLAFLFRYPDFESKTPVALEAEPIAEKPEDSEPIKKPDIIEKF